MFDHANDTISQEIIMKDLLIATALLLLLSACTSSDEEASADKESHKVLYNAVNQPLEKAKGVEQEILDNAEQQKKQMEDF